MQVVYPCVLKYEGTAGYGGYFPDIKGAYVAGATLYEALVMAEDVLRGMLISMIEDDDVIKLPSSLKDIQLTGGEFVSFVKAEINIVDIVKVVA